MDSLVPTLFTREPETPGVIHSSLASMIPPSDRGVALLVINAVFSAMAITSYVLRFLNNLSRVRKGSLPLGHFIITDTLVFGATV